MKIYPAGQHAQVTMATYQQHHQHKLEPRSPDWFQPETEGKESFLKDTSLWSEVAPASAVSVRDPCQNQAQFSIDGF